jgi:integral membrane protein (TIGR01906 family)
VLVTDQYLEFEYGKTDFPADPFGFDQAQRLALASANFRWVREGQPAEALASQWLGDQSLYNPRELKHMQDVQDVFLFTRRVWHLALGLLVLIVTLSLWRKENLLELVQGLKIGGLLVVSLVAMVGFLAVIAWQIWFVAFHQIFFAPGSWTFNPSDTLIRLFPERFWYDAALTISSINLLGGFTMALIGWYVQRKHPDVPKSRSAQVIILREREYSISPPSPLAACRIATNGFFSRSLMLMMTLRKRTRWALFLLLGLLSIYQKVEHHTALDMLGNVAVGHP